MTKAPQTSQKETAAASPLARGLRLVFFAALAVIAVLNLFIAPHEPHFGLDKYPGFWALFGLVGAVILGRGAKGLAHKFLGQNEDFYTKHTGSPADVKTADSRVAPQTHGNHKGK